MILDLLLVNYLILNILYPQSPIPMLADEAVPQPMPANLPIQAV